MGNDNMIRKRATLRVVEMMSKGMHRDIIVYKIMTEYGYSGRFVDNVIKAYAASQKALEAMNRQKEEDDGTTTGD